MISHGARGPLTRRGPTASLPWANLNDQIRSNRRIRWPTRQSVRPVRAGSEIARFTNLCRQSQSCRVAVTRSVAQVFRRCAAGAPCSRRSSREPLRKARSRCQLSQPACSGCRIKPRICGPTRKWRLTHQMRFRRARASQSETRIRLGYRNRDLAKSRRIRSSKVRRSTRAWRLACMSRIWWMRVCRREKARYARLQS